MKFMKNHREYMKSCDDIIHMYNFITVFLKIP